MFQEDLLNIVKPANKKIIEIGCGKGENAFSLSAMSKEYIGIDISKDVIDLANANIPVNLKDKLKFKIGDASCLDFDSNYFDTAVLIHSFHEMPLQIQYPVIQEVRRVLKNEGTIIVIDPVEPPVLFQECFNFINREFKFFNHSLSVIHSNWIIEECLRKNLLKLDRKATIKVDYSFNNFNELIQFLIDDYYGELTFTDEMINILKNGISEILNIKDINEDIKLCDENFVWILKNNK